MHAGGMAGGVCTARAHAAAAVAALCRDLLDPAWVAAVSVEVGRHTTTVTAPSSALIDIQGTIRLLHATPAPEVGVGLNRYKRPPKEG